MKWGVHVTTFDWRDSIAATLVELARVAEDLGASSFSLMDHWFQMEGYGPVDAPMLEGYTSLGFVAARTERIGLELLVTGVTYRHPAVLAKTVATLDVLSGGRAALGIGAAWYEREHVGLGIAFPPLSERYERLVETIEICRQMWAPGTGRYRGTHYQLAETLCEPSPVRGTVPVLIGGGGERRTLRLVAEHGDACNLYAADLDQVAHKLRVLDAHCAAIGRAPSEIERTALLPATDPADSRLADDVSALGDLGVERVVVMPVGDDPVSWVRQIARSLP